MLKKVVLTRKLPLDITPYLPNLRIDANQSSEQLPLLRLRQMMSDADAIISSSSDIIDKTLMDSAPKLKVIANYSTNYTNIDIDYARKKGIVVCASDNVITQNTAEMIFALAMATAKRIAYEDRVARNNINTEKNHDNPKPISFYKKTLGILGMDNIGQAVAKIGTGFSMEVIYNDIRHNNQSELLLGTTFANFNEILEWSDFIIISTMFDDFINEKITAAHFKRMKKSAIIVSLGSNKIMSSKDFINALEKNIIAGAGVDICDFTPQEVEMLKTFDNVTLTKTNHSGSSQSIWVDMAKLCAENVLSVLNEGIVPDNAITL